MLEENLQIEEVWTSNELTPFFVTGLPNLASTLSHVECQTCGKYAYAVKHGYYEILRHYHGARPRAAFAVEDTWVPSALIPIQVPSGQPRESTGDFTGALLRNGQIAVGARVVDPILPVFA